MKLGLITQQNECIVSVSNLHLMKVLVLLFLDLFQLFCETWLSYRYICNSFVACHSHDADTTLMQDGPKVFGRFFPVIM
jgi:hypothetical protein